MKFKDDVTAARFPDMHTMAQDIAIDAAEWLLKNYGIVMTITATVSTAEEDKALGRMSDTHRTRRAFDIRTIGIDELIINELIAYLTKKYGKHGAIVSAIPRLIVNKPHGTGPHLHVQLSRKFAKSEIKYV